MKGLLFILCCLFAVPSMANITFINGTGNKVASTPATVTTNAMSTVGANFISVIVHDLGTVVAGTLTDNQGNTWVLDTSVVMTSARTRMYSCFSPTTSATHTFTYATALTSAPNINVRAFSGVGARSVRSAAALALASSGQPGSVTPGGNGSVLLWSVHATGSLATPGAPTMTGNGYSNVSTSAFASNSSFACGSAYLIQGTAAASNPTATYAGSFPSVQILYSLTPVSYTPANSTKGFFNW